MDDDEEEEDGDYHYATTTSQVCTVYISYIAVGLLLYRTVGKGE